MSLRGVARFGTRFGTLCRALLLSAFCMTGSAAAQTSGVLFAGPGDTGADLPLVLTYDMAARVRRPGGSGWMVGKLVNRGEDAHRAEVLIGGWAGFGVASYGARFVATLKPGDSVDVLLPTPASGSSWNMLMLQSGSSTDSRQLESKGDAHLGLLVVAEPARGADLGRVLARAANDELMARFPSPAEEPDVVPPDWLPPRWTLLSGFDVILLDAAIDAEQQRVLLHAASAGAHLLLTQHGLSALPAGPLKERCAPLVDAGTESVNVGFGKVTALSGADMPSVGTLHDVLSADIGPTSGMPCEAMLLPLALTSLVVTPPGFFAAIVIAYVALLAWLLVRELRRRTPLRLLLLLPATGCALTVLVLGGGVIAEGTSVRGASRSLALLDQQAHEVTVAGGRTLYAGFWSPSPRPQPGTQVVPLGSLSSSGGQLLLNAHEGGRLDSSLLPTRTPVSLALTSVGPSRERLLVRQEADGELRLVAEDSLRPRAGGASAVLRLPDGRGFLADAEGRLQPADDAAVVAASHELMQGFIDAPLLTRGALGESWNAAAIALPDDVSFDPAPAQRALSTQVTRLLADGLPPGSYLVQLERGTLLDDLGLSIRDEEDAVHLVLGRFAPGDVP